TPGQHRGCRVTKPEVTAAEELLAAQLADLIRFRDVVEAQRAVLRTSDSDLLERFSHEAEELAATVAGREVRLLALRRSIQMTDGGREPPSVRSLAAQGDRARAVATTGGNDRARALDAQGLGLGRAS